jgi:ElaB/YqjD/DUF883 family membrane-anchored ribosome-binding protein
MIDRLKAEASLADQTEEWKARAMEAADTMRDRFHDVHERVIDYTNKQPARALGVALGLGVLLGWLIKRR